MSNYHIPVMLEETIEYLKVKPGSWYVDCNLGGGGHTEEILKNGGKVIGIDIDPDAIKEVTRKQETSIRNNNLILVQDNFLNIKQITEKFSIKPSGILFDLGVSTHQLEEEKRGFSFKPMIFNYG